eukprot:237751-Lingulodinium_polyedra.AAC.1
MERASVQFVRRWSGGPSVRPHHCASVQTMMRPNRPPAAATARKPHARTLHACTVFLACAWSA